MSLTRDDKVAPSTIVDAPLAGRIRRFQLRIGEIGELERLSRAGIGTIMLRLQTHQFYAADVWDTLRLGLQGGGTPEADATALMIPLQGQPIADYIGLASDIIVACVNGVKPPQQGDAGKTPGSGSPATSPPSTAPAAPSASTQEQSTD